MDEGMGEEDDTVYTTGYSDTNPGPTPMTIDDRYNPGHTPMTNDDCDNPGPTPMTNDDLYNPGPTPTTNDGCYNPGPTPMTTHDDCNNTGPTPTTTATDGNYNDLHEPPAKHTKFDHKNGMGEDGAALRDSSPLPGSALDTQGFYDVNCNTEDEWRTCGVPDDIFDSGADFGGDSLQNLSNDSPDLAADANDYTGVSACPAAPPACTGRTALKSKTSPGEAYDRGHTDAWPTQLPSAAAADEDHGNGEEFNLELELEKILDEERTQDNPKIDPPVNVPANIHGGYLLQIDDIIWCMHCGAAASLGNTSIYLRKPCDGKPANDSMRQRRKRLIRHQHPTTCAKLLGTHKRVRII